MIGKSLLPLLALIVITSSLSPNLSKNFFYFNADTMSPRLFQTSNGIIGYGVRDSEAGEQNSFARYINLNIKERNITLILSNLVSACGDTPTIFDRLYYHAARSTLVYYCSANSSLLILDERTYAVKSSIQTGLKEDYKEVQYYPEQNNLAILFMGPLFTGSPIPSHLIKINILTKQITLSSKLDSNLKQGEAVVGYAGNNTKSYVVTNMVDGPYHFITNLYAIDWIGSKYQLSLIGSKNEIPGQDKAVTQILILGERIVFNNGDYVYFFNSKGESTRIEKVAQDCISLQDCRQRYLKLFSTSGSSELYILFSNSTLFKYTVKGDVISGQKIGTAGHIQIAYGDDKANDLLFLLDEQRRNFTIIDIKTQERIYTSLAKIQNLLLTDSTYAVVEIISHKVDYVIYIFDSKTEKLINKVTIPQSYHFNKEELIVSYVTQESTLSKNCILKHIDIVTGRAFSSWTLKNQGVCMLSVRYSSFKNKGDAYPYAVIPKFSLISSDHMIAIPDTGIINFTPPEDLGKTSIYMNFSSMALSFIHWDQDTYKTTLYQYEFNSLTKKFKLNRSTKFSNTSLYQFDTTLGGSFVAVDCIDYRSKVGSIAIIDQKNLSIKNTTYPEHWCRASTFQDGSKNDYVLLTNAYIYDFEAPGLYGPKGLSYLPYASNETIIAGVANKCSYWTVDEYIIGAGTARFYSDCGKSSSKRIQI